MHDLLCTMSNRMSALCSIVRSWMRSCATAAATLRMSSFCAMVRIWTPCARSPLPNGQPDVHDLLNRAVLDALLRPSHRHVEDVLVPLDGADLDIIWTISLYKGNRMSTICSIVWSWVRSCAPTPPR